MGSGLPSAYLSKFVCAFNNNSKKKTECHSKEVTVNAAVIAMTTSCGVDTPEMEESPSSPSMDEEEDIKYQIVHNCEVEEAYRGISGENNNDLKSFLVKSVVQIPDEL